MSDSQTTSFSFWLMMALAVTGWLTAFSFKERADSNTLIGKEYATVGLAKHALVANSRVTLVGDVIGGPSDKEREGNNLLIYPSGRVVRIPATDNFTGNVFYMPEEDMADEASQIIRNGGTVIYNAHLCVKDANRIWGTVPKDALVAANLFDDKCNGEKYP